MADTTNPEKGERFPRTTLGDEDRDRFIAILDADEEPTPALQSAVADYRRRVDHRPGDQRS